MALSKRSSQTKAEYSSHVPAVDQAARILLALAEDASAAMTLTDVCRAVGIHKSKGYSILNTLQQFAFVQRSPDSKTYGLGPGLLYLAGRVLNTLDLREAVSPVLHKLSRETDSTAFLGLISDGHVFVVAKDEGTQEIGLTIRLGHRFPLAWGAHGKAIVAFLPEEERERVLRSAKPYFHGARSKFDPNRLRGELAQCRKTGFALDLGDMKAGIHAVASPVFGHSGKLIGSIAVVGTFPKERVEKYGSAVAKAGRAFSKLLQGAPKTSV
ncbi:MAG: IclR family transcriptional regulator [Thermodesulfobacteriota bacterium]